MGRVWTEVQLVEFMKLKTPTFYGLDTSQDAQDFLYHIKVICNVLSCISTRMVELAAFRLGRAA